MVRCSVVCGPMLSDVVKGRMFRVESGRQEVEGFGSVMLWSSIKPDMPRAE